VPAETDGGGHAAAQTGLRAIQAHLGPNSDVRAAWQLASGHKDRVAGYVLTRFAKAIRNGLDDVHRLGQYPLKAINVGDDDSDGHGDRRS